MFVEKVKIISYKTIVTEQQLDVDPKTTVLVGGNETGKTNVLEAISKFSLDNDFELEDISRSTYRYRQGILPNVGIVFLLSEEDQQKLTTISPSMFSDFNKLEIWKKGKGPNAYYVMISKEKTDEISARGDTLRKHTETLSKEIAELSQQAKELQKIMASEKKLLASLPPEKTEEATKSLQRLTNEDSRITGKLNELRAKLEASKNELDVTSQILKRLKNSFLNLTPEETKQALDALPEIYSPGKIEFLPEEIPISALISQPTKNENKVVSNLLKLGGIDNLEILKEQTRRRRIALRRAGQRISEQLSQIWKQEKIEFQITANEELLRVNLEEPVSISAPPEERSEGFRWFLSFYVQFIVDTQEQLKNTLILLDDPAVNLHPNGQKDFLVILDRIAENNQVIYTTHSPFLMNKNFPGRARLLEKKENGTLINNKPYSNGKSRFWEPLRSAIGVSLGDSLFLGGRNLIVEGVSDQIILTGFNQKFATLGKPYVDLEEVAIVPGMGADSVVQLAILAYSEKLPTMMLLDSDEKGDSIVQKIDKKMPQLKKKVSIMRTKDFKEEAQTIEDLIPNEDYLKAVNSAYSRTIDGFKKISGRILTTKEEPKEAPKSKSKKKEQGNISAFQSIVGEFKKRGYGFDKVLVAKELVNTIQPEDLEKAEYEHLGKLFEKIIEHYER